jgi:hypothetical protein
MDCNESMARYMRDRHVHGGAGWCGAITTGGSVFGGVGGLVVHSDGSMTPVKSKL